MTTLSPKMSHTLQSDVHSTPCIALQTPGLIRLADTMATTTLLDLNNELLLMVIENLDPLTWVQLAVSCKRIRALVLRESLWRGVLHVQAHNAFKSLALMRWVERVVGVPLTMEVSIKPTCIVARLYKDCRKHRWVYRVPDEEELH